MVSHRFISHNAFTGAIPTSFCSLAKAVKSCSVGNDLDFSDCRNCDDVGGNVVSGTKCHAPCPTCVQPATTPTVTCTFSVDNALENFFINGVDRLGQVTGLNAYTDCKTNWKHPCTISFTDTSFTDDQVIAFKGKDEYASTNHNYCGSSKAAGVLLMCNSTNPASPWNTVQATTATDSTSWESYSSSSAAPPAAAVSGYETAAFVGSPAWNPAKPTSSAFNCAKCDLDGATGPRTLSKMWADGCSRYAYFRKVVPKVCLLTTQ